MDYTILGLCRTHKKVTEGPTAGYVAHCRPKLFNRIRYEQGEAGQGGQGEGGQGEGGQGEGGQGGIAARLVLRIK